MFPTGVLSRDKLVDRQTSLHHSQEPFSMYEPEQL